MVGLRYDGEAPGMTPRKELFLPMVTFLMAKLKHFIIYKGWDGQQAALSST